MRLNEILNEEGCCSEKTNYGRTKYRLFRAIKKSSFLKTNDKKQTEKKTIVVLLNELISQKILKKLSFLLKEHFFKQTFERYDCVLT